MTAWLGIDVSKRKFDVRVEWDGRTRAKVFANDPDGWQRLCTWLESLGIGHVHAGLEATGRYGEGLALALHERGHRVSLINPARIKHFARTKLGRNKTDTLDAALIGEYVRLFTPAIWVPPAPAVRRLRDLVRTREALKAAVTEWRNRGGAGTLAEAADGAIRRVIEGLEEELDALECAIEATIAGDAELRRRHDLLVSVPGVGTLTAAAILTELPGRDVLQSAREAAAYAGLNPSQHRSGASERPARISRIGNATLRTALFFPALAGMRCNPAVKALRERLMAQGRLKPKQILVAAMRKMLHLCYGVLKTGRPFDAHHVANLAPAAAA